MSIRTGLLVVCSVLPWLSGCGSDAPAVDAVRLVDRVAGARIESAVDLADEMSTVLSGAEILFDDSFAAGTRPHEHDWVRDVVFGAGGGVPLVARVLPIALAGKDPLLIRVFTGRRLEPDEALFFLELEQAFGEEEAATAESVQTLIAGGRKRARAPAVADGTGADGVTYWYHLVPSRRPWGIAICSAAPRDAFAEIRIQVARLAPRGSRILGSRRLGESPWCRSLALGPDRETSEAIFLGVPGRVAIDLRVPARRPLFTAEVVIVTAPDSRRTEVALEVTGGDQTLRAAATVENRTPTQDSRSKRWTPLEIDLGGFAGAEVTVSLVARPVDGEAGAIVAFRNALVAGDPLDLPPDVIIISLDTTRADRMSLHGNGRATTPYIDQLAATSQVFDAAVAPAPWTLPAHITLFSGQYPDRHGVYNDFSRLPGGSPWLAAEFRAAGYHTVGATGGGYVGPHFGFAAGFEVYGTADPACPPLSWAERRPQYLNGEAVAEAHASLETRGRLLDLLRAPRRRPLFLFAHTYQAHEYHAAPEVLREFGARPEEMDALLDGVYTLDPRTNPFFAKDRTEEEQARLRRQALLIYDAALRGADEFVRDIVEAQRACGRLDRTILIVTSDHGEELLDRGMIGHGKTLYEEQVHVPLLISGLGVTPGRSPDPVSLVDIAPTLRELCGLASPTPELPWSFFQDGRSLAPLLAGGALPPQPVLARGGTRDPLDPTLRALRSAHLKYLTQDPAGGDRTRALFDLACDPRELADLAGLRPQEAAGFDRRLADLVERLESVRQDGARAQLSGEALEDLEQLGYLGDR